MGRYQNQFITRQYSSETEHQTLLDTEDSQEEEDLEDEKKRAGEILVILAIILGLLCVHLGEIQWPSRIASQLRRNTTEEENSVDAKGRG